MSNSVARWMGFVSPSRRRRQSFMKVQQRIEDLEPRLVLSRDTLLPISMDAPAIVAVEPAAAPLSTASSMQSSTFHVPGGKKKNEVIDVKQWQGTWNISTDIPFLSNGTLQIRQLAEKKFEATTTGMSGNQFTSLKAQYTKEGDPQLHFKMKANDLEGKPKVIGFQVDLNVSTMTFFSGFAKVSGGHHPHSISGTRQPGTGPTTAEVSVVTDEFRPKAKAGEEYTFFVYVNSLGTAAIPTGGVRVNITFTGATPTFVSAENPLGKKSGFVSITASPPGGPLTITGIGEALSSTNHSTLAMTVKVIAPAGSFSYTATVSDNNGGTIPDFPDATSEIRTVNPE